MNDSEALQKEIENLRERLSRLSRASLRIAGDLAVLDDAGQVEALLALGLTSDELR